MSKKLFFIVYYAAFNFLGIKLLFLFITDIDLDEILGPLPVIGELASNPRYSVIGVSVVLPIIFILTNYFWWKKKPVNPKKFYTVYSGLYLLVALAGLGFYILSKPRLLIHTCGRIIIFRRTDGWCGKTFLLFSPTTLLQIQ